MGLADYCKPESPVEILQGAPALKVSGPAQRCLAAVRSCPGSIVPSMCFSRTDDRWHGTALANLSDMFQPAALQMFWWKTAPLHRKFEAPALPVFFPSSMADVALRLGPYVSISSKTSICTRTKRVRKCRQITINQTTHRPARRDPANPPARLAFRQEKQQTRHTKGAGAQTKTPTKKICQRTQWFDHCITFKNMRK